MTLYEFNEKVNNVLNEFDSELEEKHWSYEGYGFTYHLNENGSHYFNFSKIAVIKAYICFDGKDKTLIIRSNDLNKDYQIYDYDFLVKIGVELKKIFDEKE